MSWQPIVHRWASRIALLGFGIVAGGLTDEVAALDPAAEHQPRVSPTERSTELS